MNNYIAFEITDFQKKLNGYNMLFNYRMTNLCVKAEATALMPVTVRVANTEYNLEEVADILKPDDFTFDIYPKNQNNLQAIIDGIFDVHPEFKMELKTDKNENDENAEEIRHVLYTMPMVNKDRRDLLNETTKTFHKECVASLELTNTQVQERLVEVYTKMPTNEADEARVGFKKVYNDAKDECEQLLKLKLDEIEEAYQRYLTEDNDRLGNPDAGDDDDDMVISHDAEVEALFN
jgi:ribosome recycling factor